MKCPNCNGTGNIANGMWLCCECQGTGFIEEVEQTKIKCDDCKHADDCVDYGWQGCKKFTPREAEHLLICKRVDECDNGKLCAMLRKDMGKNVQLLGCSLFVPKEPKTNEQWLKSLNTEQLADVLNGISLESLFAGQMHDLPKRNGTKAWVEWLKQQHKE